MTHNYNTVFETDNPYWQRVLDIFAKNAHYEKKVVSGRNLHHKFPRSFSRILSEPVDNDKDNLVSLSLADHFLVHYYYYLLARKGFRQSMSTAFILMAKKSLKYITPETAEVMAKDYDDMKKYMSHAHTEETRRKISKAMKGKKLAPYSEEHRRHMSESMKGKNAGKTRAPFSDETRRKMSESRNGKVWINDGIRNYRIDPSNPIPEGFKLGRIIKCRE